jgi:Rrf2 family protein
MEISLSRRGDYSVRAVLDLARHYGQGRRKSREIAATMDVPAKYLPQILANLIRHDLLVSMAGPDGGYSLARPPGEISLLSVIEAAEGPVAAKQCALRGGPCDWDQVCPLHEAWSRGQEAIVERFGATSFAELADTDARIEAGAYEVTTEVPHRRQRRGARA